MIATRSAHDANVRKAPDLPARLRDAGWRIRTMSMAQTFFVEDIDTPTGRMRVVSDDAQRLRSVDWADHETRMLKLLRRHYGPSAVSLHALARRSHAADALAAYFDGQLEAVADLTTETNGTPFQRAVWAALRRIPAGRTMSYGALAA